MISWLLPTILAILGFGLGSVLQKHGLTTRERRGRILAELLGSRLWLLGTALNIGGALILVLAVDAGQLSVVQPLVSTNLLVALLLGVALLGERMSRREWLALAVLMAGATVLLASTEGGGAVIPMAVSSARAIPFLGLGLILAVLPALLHRRASRLPREIPPALAAGILFGLGTVCVKWLTLRLRLAGPALSLPEAILRDPVTIGVVLLNASGFLLYQLALTRGRVSLASPLVNIAGLLPPLLAGGILFGEPMGPLRLAGAIGILLGVGVLAYSRPSTDGIRSGQPNRRS